MESSTVKVKLFLSQGPALGLMAEDGLTEAPEAVVCAVHVRPLIASELQEGCAESLVVTPESPQVSRAACHSQHLA